MTSLNQNSHWRAYLIRLGKGRSRISRFISREKVSSGFSNNGKKKLTDAATNKQLIDSATAAAAGCSYYAADQFFFHGSDGAIHRCMTKRPRTRCVARRLY